MKTSLAILCLVLSTSIWAAKCNITGIVSEAGSCHRLSTRLDVSDLEACEAFAKSTQTSNFFNLLSKKQQLISTRYVYRARGFKKGKGEFIFSNDEVCY